MSNQPLQNCNILITGITDLGSLALAAARQVKKEGANLICTGLGLTPYHSNLSDKAKAYLDKTYSDFKETIAKEFGDDTLTLPLDVTLDGSLEDVANTLKAKGIKLNGLLHSIAMDKTIRAGAVKPLIEVSREEFMGAMDVSAYSLIALTRSLLQKEVLQKNSSILSISYLGAEKIVRHPYKNVGVAKAALERITRELAFELGKSHQIKVNSIRFSPFTGSKAGGAIQGLQEAFDFAEENAPLGNAIPEDLGYEVAYLLRPYGRITGEIRHVDGGYNIRG
ncbi:MAG TPA: SDR family oxidoreductase [Leptospiraceae bacterium]|nr:SDR family oxidoreductase [Leptospiraceae bacterium]HMW06739.1 SDR family oxidoreductase [Leptospiraceae bacterium]HMX33692.1 SDR family oxidoreductase [Leptospiraceae bacterium]HMY32045.1 SDR family oxidoreductase [Leptospiraceae bacterium]HMZ63968.1 SDR family oxidoreductase [Leptospiraceae bacterium]